MPCKARSTRRLSFQAIGSAVHCVRFDRDGLVYVCDRSNSRFQIFRRDGRFEREVFVARGSGGAGTVYDLEFSPDQSFLYVADGANQRCGLFAAMVSPWSVRLASAAVVRDNSPRRCTT